MLIDAALFSPQSRQRLFIIAHKGRIPSGLISDEADPLYHPPALRARPSRAYSDTTHMAWAWWRLPHPVRRNADLASLLDRAPSESVWRSDADTQKLMSQMAAPLRRQRVEKRRARSALAARRCVPAHTRRTGRAHPARRDPL